jgi:hypothetical protein
MDKNIYHEAYGAEVTNTMDKNISHEAYGAEVTNTMDKNISHEAYVAEVTNTMDKNISHEAYGAEVTNTMDDNLSHEANISPVGIQCLLWNPTFHYHVHTIQSVARMSHTSQFLNIHFNSNHPSTPTSS